MFIYQNIKRFNIYLIVFSRNNAWTRAEETSWNENFAFQHDKNRVFKAFKEEEHFEKSAPKKEKESAASPNSEIKEAFYKIDQLEKKIKSLETRTVKKYPDVKFLTYKDRRRILVGFRIFIQIFSCYNFFS